MCPVYQIKKSRVSTYESRNSRLDNAKDMPVIYGNLSLNGRLGVAVIAAKGGDAIKGCLCCILCICKTRLSVTSCF